MAPRKSNISVVSTTNDDGTGTPAKAESREPGNSIDDLLLPKTMVQRLAKGVLPPNTQLQKDAVTAIQRAATLFVNHLAQIANTTTQTNNRKTIPPQAVLDALKELEFGQFLPRVEAELVKFEDVQKKKRTDYRNKLKDEENKKKTNGDEGVEAGEETIDHAENATNGDDVGNDTEMATHPQGEGEQDDQRAAKRARLGSEKDGADGGAPLSNGGGGSSSRMNGHRRESDGSKGDDADDQDTFEDAAEEQDDAVDEDVNGEEEDEEEEEEEEEEEDDEDEYPDEGRRLSSIEADNDANVAGDARMAEMDSADEMQDSD